MGDDGDRAGVAEVAARGVDAVRHQRLDVVHVVLVDDLLAQGVDDDDHDLGRSLEAVVARGLPAPPAWAPDWVPARVRATAAAVTAASVRARR